MNPSASTAHRGDKCPPSHVLCRVLETGDAAERGNEAHAFFRRVAKDPTDKSAALQTVPPHLYKMCANLDLATALDGLQVVGAELAYVVDPRAQTVRFVGENIGREYGPLGEWESGCTLDVHAMTVHEPFCPAAVDWKTGKNIGEVSDSLQMKIQAMVIWLAAGAKHDRVLIRVVYVNADGSVYCEEYWFNVFEIMQAMRDLVNIDERIYAAKAIIDAGKMPDLVRGDWCGYCPCAPYCPSVVGLAKRMHGELPIIQPEKLQELSTFERGALWERIKEYKAYLKAVEDQMKLLMTADGAFPATEDGKEYRMVPKSRVYLNDEMVRGELFTIAGRMRDVLLESGLTEEQTIKAMERIMPGGPSTSIQKVSKITAWEEPRKCNVK